MEQNIKKINILAAILGAAIILSFVIVGSIFDYDISKALYNPADPGLFAISGSLLAQAPTFLGVTFAGALLIVSSKAEVFKAKKNLKNGLLIAGLVSIALGTFFSFYYALKLKDFETIEKGTIYFVLLAVCALVFVGLNALIVFFTIKKGNSLNYKKYLQVAFLILMVVVLEVLIYQALKVIVSRPRPRYIFSLEEPRRIYQNWWDLSHPFKALIDENCKSCPSGHASNGMALPFIAVAITYLKKDTKPVIRLIIFILGFIYAVIWSFSRIYAGAHFFSDIGLGMLITFITGIVIWNFFIKKYKLNQYEEIQ